MKRPLPRNSATLFQKIFNSAPSITAAAEKLGISPSSCKARASQLRKAGHKLKYFRLPPAKSLTHRQALSKILNISRKALKKKP